MPEIPIRLLGTVQIDAGNGPTAPQGGRVSTLLALLAMEAGRVVSLDRIMQQLWGDEPPASGRSTLYAYVSRLRNQLEDTQLRIVARSPGYVLDATRESVDAHVFTELVTVADEHAAAESWEEVLAGAGKALTLWRGTPFADTLPGDDLSNEAKRLERLAERAHELTARALLVLGRTDEAVRRAEDLIARDNFNESYWRLRMRAEHAGGRTAVALSTYETFRQLMSDELGIDPSERMRSLHLEILRSTDSSDGDGTAVTPSVSFVPEEPEVMRPIGRVSELTLLDRAVDGGLHGQGRMILIEGEAGIGKTRLAEYASDRARHLGMTTVWARAIDGAGTPPMWVWEQVLGQLRRSSASHESGAEILRQFTSSPASDTAPEDARFILYRRIVDELLRAADRSPVLVVLDDAQWADDGTLQTLRILAPALRDRACTVVVTARHRSSGTSDLLTSIGREAGTDRLNLRALTRDDVAALATAEGYETDEGVDSLWSRSGGNPYLLTELLRTGPSTPISATIAEMFEHRLAALPDDSRSMLRLAAVAGRSLDPLVLARAAEGPVADVIRSLDPVRAEGLVVSDGAIRTLSFAHDLAREAILARLAPVETAELHGCIADAIVAVHADDLNAHLDELANHRYAAAAGAPSIEAFEACMAAADHAASRLAYDQAAVHRARALSSLVPGVEHRDVRFEVLIELTAERQLAGDAVGAMVTMRQALDLARLMDDAVLMRRAVGALGEVTLWNWRHFDQVDEDTIEVIESILDAPQDSPMRRVPDAERAPLLGSLAVELYYSGDDQRCLELAREAVQLARPLGDPALLGRVLNNFAIATWFPRFATERREKIDETLALAEHGLPRATELVALLHRAPLHLEQGDVGSFAELLARAEWLAPRLGRLDLESQVAFQRIALSILSGELPEASDLLERTVRQYARTSLWGADWTSLNVRAHLARVEGKLPEITDLLTAKASQDANRTLRWTAVLALAESGDLAQARALQRRWGLTSMPRRPHWGSPFEWAQAAEVALLLGSPSPMDAYDVLSVLENPVILIGTALAVHGPVDVLRARLAAELGDETGAMQHRAAALAVTEAVQARLGVTPSWSLEVP